MSKQNLLELLKKSDEKTLSMIYLENRLPFINFAKKSNFSDEDITDAYQDAIIILREKAISGALNQLNSSIKTYLFAIGKHILQEKKRRNNRQILKVCEEKNTTNFQETTDEFWDTNLSEFQEKIQKGLQSMGKKCQEILTLFYYRGYTIEEITEELNYENKNVAKSQKSRCLKILKEKSNL